MIEVRGVFRSWDTLVISSALKRSLFICSFTEAASPSEMLFSTSAWPRRSAGRWAVSIWWFRFPAAMISVPFRTRPKPADHQHRPMSTARLTTAPGRGYQYRKGHRWSAAKMAARYSRKHSSVFQVRGSSWKNTEKRLHRKLTTLHSRVVRVSARTFSRTVTVRRNMAASSTQAVMTAVPAAHIVSICPLSAWYAAQIQRFSYSVSSTSSSTVPPASSRAHTSVKIRSGQTRTAASPSGLCPEAHSRKNSSPAAAAAKLSARVR